jgi:hypothetical protein
MVQVAETTEQRPQYLTKEIKKHFQEKKSHSYNSDHPFRDALLYVRSND